MILAAEVSNRTSPDLGRTIENENGEETYLNWMFASLELIPEAGEGRVSTLAGTW